MTQEEFNKKQQDLYLKISSALLDVIPEHWDSLELVSSLDEMNDENDYGFYIQNPDGLTDVIVVPELIFDLYSELENIFDGFSKKWVKSSFIVRWSHEIENWKYETNYNYG